MKTEIYLAAKFIVKLTISGPKPVAVSFGQRLLFLKELVTLLHEHTTVSLIILNDLTILKILNEIVSYRATGIPSSRREDRATAVCASTDPQAPTRWCWKRPKEPTSHTAR
jgi:hypothetical protein